MYGTVARLQIKPGKLDEMLKLEDELEDERSPGYIGQYVYQMDDDPNIFYVAVLFESREAYRANADSPEQHERYLQWRELLAADPEWHDGEIVFPVE